MSVAVGTILAEYDETTEEWSFRVVGCRCLTPSGKLVSRHRSLVVAEDCARRVRGSKPLAQRAALA